MRYNLRLFTDTNSVICKIIVEDGFPVPREEQFSASDCGWCGTKTAHTDNGMDGFAY